jgi:thioredoxin reductase
MSGVNSMTDLPVAVIGAGPVGLAAAAHLVSRGLVPLVLERRQVGATVAEWAHVRVFSPWEYNVDSEGRRLLERTGWTMPDPDHLPTGAELIRDYLAPLAAHPAISPHVRFGAEVVTVTRQGRSKLASEGRDAAPFVLVWRDRAGPLHRTLARAVIDASGTWVRPNPIGIDGLPVDGEAENADRIAYGIPDVLGVAREKYGGRHTLVVGGGHSAINAALDLLDLQDQAPRTRVTWATRSGGIERLLGGGLDDELPGRGRLGLRAAEAVRSGRVSFRSPFAVDRIRATATGLAVEATDAGQPTTLEVDRIVVATGFRPDLAMHSELRLSLDPVVETTPALAPLIDPNLHSCGTVRPHGVVELSHPEKDFYIVGMKSYGRAPTFLMTTGYEQVRSVVAELAGDHAAARAVRLKLPETGVCRTRATPAASGATGCCGGAPKADASACCVADEVAKSEGRTGSGSETRERVAVE